MKKKFLLFWLLLLVKLLSAQSLNSYEQEIEQWKIGRYAALKNSSGWLNLAGLFWLDQGKNSFGSGTNNKIIFPKGTIQNNAGYFELVRETVRIYAAKEIVLKVDGKAVKNSLIFSPDAKINSMVTAGALHWTIIKREDKIGIRLWDNNSYQLTHFKGINRFPTDSTLKLDAILKEPLFATTIPIKNVLGQVIQMKLLGKLIFILKGQVLSLDAVEEGDELFIIFGDATNTKSTYGAGRFLYAPKPDAAGKTVVDFNKAFNPPCAFTPFATCPLPPPQNILSVAIEAGELNYGKH